MTDKLVDRRRRDILKTWAIDECYFRKPALTILDDKNTLYDWIVDYFGRSEPLTYLEFGVAHGDSIKFFSEKFSSQQSQFIGFDSFEGLPEPWLHMPRFFFDRGGRPPEIVDQRVQFLKGWFQNSLPPFLAEWSGPNGKVFIHFDADLYGSTLFALTMIWQSIKEYYFMMDDFQYDDSVALFDFISAYPVDVEFIAQAGRDGNGKLIPLKIFAHLSTKRFQPSNE